MARTEITADKLTEIINGLVPGINDSGKWINSIRFEHKFHLITVQHLSISGVVSDIKSSYRIVFENVTFLDGVFINHKYDENLLRKGVAYETIEHAISLIRCTINSFQIQSIDRVKIVIFNCFDLKVVFLRGLNLDFTIDQEQQEHALEKIILSTPTWESGYSIDSNLGQVSIINTRVKELVVKQGSKTKVEAISLKQLNIDLSEIGNISIESQIDLFKIKNTKVNLVYWTGFCAVAMISDSSISTMRHLGTGGGDYYLHDVRIKQIIFSKNVHFSKVRVSGKSDLESLLIGNSSFNDFVILGQTKIECVILPIRLMRFNTFTIKGDSNEKPTVNIIRFLDGYLQNGLSEGKSSVTLENFSISNIGFFNFRNESNIFISKLTVTKSSGKFEYSKLSQLYLAELNAEGVIVEKDFSESPQFTIANSDLGKINFISCDFSDMVMDFRASKIVEIFLSGTEMPEKILSNVKDQQIGYAQLRKVYENRGDSVKSLEYLSHELNEHFEALKKIEFKNRTPQQQRDYLTLSAHKYSNNFGTSYSNWKWGLLIMLFIFILHNFFLGYTVSFLSRKDQVWSNFFELLSLFPEFLLPIHKADFIPEAVKMEVTSSSRLVDFFGRIISGYFIYQFIQAFRKYGKK